MKQSSFPVMLDHDFRSRTARSLREVGSCFTCIGIPRALMGEHLEQVYRNHGTGIENLALRGGLGADECLAILEDRQWIPLSEAELHAKLVQAVFRWQRISGLIR